MTNHPNRQKKAREVITQVRAVLADVKLYNDRLNDPQGDGSGDDAQPPTGDDYNAVLDLLDPLYALVEATRS